MNGYINIQIRSPYLKAKWYVGVSWLFLGLFFEG